MLEYYIAPHWFQPFHLGSSKISWKGELQKVNMIQFLLLFCQKPNLRMSHFVFQFLEKTKSEVQIIAFQFPISLQKLKVICINKFSIAPFFYNQNKVPKSITCFSTLLFSIKTKNKKRMAVWIQELIRYVPMLVYRLNMHLPSEDLYKRLQQNMVQFPLNGNVNQ